MKWIPGPWKADVRAGCVAVYPGPQVNCICESEGKRLFYAGGFQVYDEDGKFLYWDTNPEDVANAHLIAAAPELYEALERLVGYGNIFGYREGERSPYKQAMTALAKARGETK